MSSESRWGFLVQHDTVGFTNGSSPPVAFSSSYHGLLQRVNECLNKRSHVEVFLPTESKEFVKIVDPSGSVFLCVGCRNEALDHLSAEEDLSDTEVKRPVGDVAPRVPRSVRATGDQSNSVTKRYPHAPHTHTHTHTSDVYMDTLENTNTTHNPTKRQTPCMKRVCSVCSNAMSLIECKSFLCSHALDLQGTRTQFPSNRQKVLIFVGAL